MEGWAFRDSDPVGGHEGTILSGCERSKTHSLPLAVQQGPLPRYVTVLPGERFVSLAEDFVSIGSDPTCDIVIADSVVSRRHCRLERRREAWWVVDTHSKNGTFLNGVRLSSGLVRAGDVIGVGRHVLKLTSTHRSNRSQGKVTCGQMVSADSVMKELFRNIEGLAGSDLTVCVRGESGTGKELVARALHDLGARREGPFIPINCGALPAELLESELFGYEKGAFTGADKGKPGVFEAAHKGTLFLDEIGELPVDQQAALLRVLDAGQVRRLGSAKWRSVDVRVVCATNRPLESMVAMGLFREDLFYRLWEAVVSLPPLRDRPGDIMVLVHHFLLRDKSGSHCSEPTYAQADRLLKHTWRGNVRELRSVVRRAAVLGWDAALDGLLSVGALHDGVAPGVRGALSSDASEEPAGQGQASTCGEAVDAAYRAGVTTIGVLDRLEEKLIVEAMRHAGGNQAKAARFLGIHRSTLRLKWERIRQR